MAETDHGLALRGGVIAKLLASPAFAARFADRMYGATPPAPIPGWPFGRMELAESEPDEDSCSIGEITPFSINLFFRPEDGRPDVEAEARLGVKMVKRILGGTLPVLELEPGEDAPVPVMVEMQVVRTIVRRDESEPGAYQGRVEFSARTAEEA